MTKQFAFDLKVALKKSGLTLSDCAHLLGVRSDRLSKYLSGKERPSIRQLCKLLIIFGWSFERAFADELGKAGRGVAKKLAHLSQSPLRVKGLINRRRTLRRLAARLEASNDGERGCGL